MAIQNYDNGFLIAGSPFTIIRTDQFGDTLWIRNLGGGSALGLIATLDGDLIAVGSDYHYMQPCDLMLAKLNQFGDTIWVRFWGGSSNDYGYSVVQTADSCFIIAGTTQSFGLGNSDGWVIKVNPYGDTIWTKTFGGNYNDYLYCIAPAGEDDYVVAGATSSFGNGSDDIWVLKINGDGDTLWTKCFGQSGPEASFSIKKMTDGGFIVSGYTGSDGPPKSYILKLNENGDSIWTRSFDNQSYAYSITESPEGYLFVGDYYGGPGYGSAEN